MRKGRFHNLHVVVVLILCLSFMLAVFGVFSVNADSTDHEEVYELIILLDRSQSIYSTDTKNVSVDCLKALPDVCPTGTRLYVTVICYWNACKVVLDGVDVKTEAGKQKLVDACESIKADTKHHGTRTGSALKKAYDIISTTKRSYEPDRQAVILFTDGDVNVYGSIDGMTLAEEMALGEENVQKMATLDIPLFCYGLSFGNNGISAKGEAWLRKLCEMSGEGNGKSNCRICSKADDIDYNSVYTFLSEMSEIPAVEITGGKELYLHGEVVQEANIVLHCPKRFREVYLKTPSGKTVVAVNYSTGESSVDSAICSVSDTGNRSAVTVKLVAGGAPLETGNWYVSFKSEEEGGTATLRVLTLYQDLGLNVNGANHAVIGSTVNYTVNLKNYQTHQDVQSKSIYSGSVVKALVTGPSGKTSEVYGALSKTGDCFDVPVSYAQDGEYTVEFAMKCDELFKDVFYYTRTLRVNVSGVAINLDIPDGVAGRQELTGAVTLSVAGMNNSELAEYLGDGKINVTVEQNGTKTSVAQCAVKDMKDAAFTFKWTPESIGAYTVTATLTAKETAEISASRMVTVGRSTIEETHNIAPLIEGTFSEKIISLKGVFVDSDGDPVKLTASTEGSAAVTAVIEGTDLKLTAKGFGTAVVTLVASDGFGAEKRKTVTVKVVPPIIRMEEVGSFERGKGAPLTVELVDGISQMLITELPAFMKDVKVKVLAEDAEDQVTVAGECNGSDYSQGKFSIPQWVPASSGMYSVHAVLSAEGMADVSSSTVTVTATHSTIRVADGKTFPASLSGVFSRKEINLTGILVDSDGDPISYEVQGDGSVVKASMDGDKLILEAQKPGVAYVDVIATDGDGASLKQTVKVEVLMPTIKLTVPSEVDRSQGADIIVALLDPASGERITGIPPYIQNGTVTVTAEIGGQTVTLCNKPLTDMKNGVITMSGWIPDDCGSYKVSAVLEVGTTKILSEIASVSVPLSEIRQNENVELPDSVSGYYSKNFRKVIDLNGLFTDSDGDELQFTAECQGDNIQAVIEDGFLIITATGKGEGKVIVRIGDGHGAEEYTMELEVNLKSMTSVYITIAIIVVSILILAVVACFIIRSTCVISFDFDMEITATDEDNNTESAVYSVKRLTSKKGAPPTVDMQTLLNRWSIHKSGSESAKTVLARNCALSGMKLTGKPFHKRGMSIVYISKTGKTPVKKKLVYTNRPLTANLGGGNSIRFGKPNAFNKDEY